MKLRKWIAVSSATAALSLFAAPHAQAGPGEWDDLGYRHFYDDGADYYPYRTSAVKSGGGNFKVCINTASTGDGPQDIYILEEDDPGYPDTPVGEYLYEPGCWVFRNIGSFVDGSNHRAEFYIRTNDPSAMSVHYYD
ncbi:MULTISPECIES: hypothetical protein [Streptomyces]|uniref:Secreted protein n=1 Tax=Streptomyces canarius TaxID=285453 RepID=A0ABQ3CG95_9ACTN|nr:hypothetical protein [Streptomyces canarius]GHA09249.1 hypothetical protein GCM10010345_12130 [Streptomyces canarius]